MSENSDTRVMNMRINNKDFLRGASDSLKAIGDLNKGIDGAGKSKGFQNMGADVQKVQSHFGALQVAGVAALGTIVSKATTAGLSMVKSLTISPIMDGFREYEKLLTSTQTIAANTNRNNAAGIAQVGKYLDNLNHYSDKTVYNFGQMADNLGRFTAAGVPLGQATTAIKGLANAAALAGSTNEQLGTAMYQVSQALSTGTIKLMDWNSLSNAGLGGKNIQQSFRDTAEAVSGSSKTVDDAIKKYGSFRESLRSGWLTADIFTKSMKVFAGQTFDATSKVKDLRRLGIDETTIAAIRAGKSFNFVGKNLENLRKNGLTQANIDLLETGETVAFTVKQLQKMGYTKEAAVRMAELARNAQDSATKIKTFSQLMDVLKEAVGSGFAQVFRQLFGNLQEAGKLWTKVGGVITGAIGKIFNGITSMLNVWHNMEDTETGLNGYGLAWAAIGNIFKTIGNILKPFVQAIYSLLPATDDAGSGLFSMTKAFYDFTLWMEKATRGTGVFGPVLKTIGFVLKVVVGIVKAVVTSFFDLLNIFAPLGISILGLAEKIGLLVGNLLEMVNISGGLGGLFDVFLDARRAVLDPFVLTLAAIVDALATLVDGDFSGFKKQFLDAFTNLAPIGDMLTKGKEIGLNLMLGVVEGLRNPGPALDAIASWVTQMLDFFKGLLGINSPSTVFKEYGKNIVEGLANGISSAITIAIEAIKGFGTAVKDAFVGTAEFISPAISAIGDGIGWLYDKLKDFTGGIDKFDIANGISVIFGGAVFLSVKRFMDAFGASMTTFKGFADDIRKQVTGPNGILGQTTNSLKAMQKGIYARAILDIALAIGVLAISLYILSKIDGKDMAKGLVGLTAAVGLLVVVMKTLNGVAVSFTKTGIVGLLAMSLSMIGLAAALIILAGALFLFSKVIAVYAKMKWGDVIKGLGMMALVLIAIGVASYPLAGIAPGLLIASFALLVLSVSMLALLGTIAAFAKLDWDTLKAGLGKMAVVLLALGIAMIPLAALSPGILIASGALLVLSVAMLAMLGTLSAFAAIDAGKFWKGLGLIAAALVVIGIAAVIAAPGLIALGAAVLIIGAGLLLAGIGMTLFGAGLAVAAAAGVAAGAVLFAAFEAFLALLPILGVQLVAALESFLKALAEKSPSIVSSLVKLGTELLRGIRELAPEVGKTVIVLLEELLKVLISKTQDIVGAAVKFIAAFVQGLADGAPDLLAAMADLVISLVEELTKNIPDLVKAGADFVVALLGGIGAQTEQLAMAAGKLILDFLTAIDLAIETYTPQIVAMGVEIAQDLILGIIQGLVPDQIEQAFSYLVEKVVGFGRNIVEGLGQGIQSAFGFVTGIIGSLVTTIVSFVAKLPGRIGAALSKLGGILRGAFSSAFAAARGAVTSGITAIGAAIGKVPGIIRGLISKAGSAAKSLGKAVVDGIKNGLSGAVDAVGGVGKAVLKGMRSAINSILPIKIPKVTIGKGKVKFTIGGGTLIPEIPAFAKGVTGFRGGSALVGEAGPELVTMGRGSNVITNKNLVEFMRSVTRLTQAISGKSSTGSGGGNITYRVGADFQGDPRTSGVAFAANITAGLINGLKARQGSVDSAMASVASGGSQSFADILGIKSPSTVFKRYAGFVSQGFINGLLASVKSVSTASSKLADAAKYAFLNSISDGRLQLEARSAVADAYASAADLVEKQAKKTKNKKKKKKLETEADRLDRRARQAEKAAVAQQKKVEAAEAAAERKRKYDELAAAGDKQGMADMKTEDAQGQATKASVQREKALRLAKEADLVRKYDKARARDLDKQAKAALALSQKYAAQSGKFADEAKKLTDEAKAAVTAEMAAQLTSVTAQQVLDAQSMFDLYTKQMADVSDAAKQDVPPSVTYEQNIYSPEALSPSEVYRNSKNLLSMTEKKLVGAAP